ncbi:hypothetical protein J1N35_006134 [Gossypium stocksii]|uniref:Uncharacterized protein n=1 Tax=Gossypium stocksii TaxID=47602 RepID=A0A9D4AJ95_9ROSI|nr:hypothetical protein J1N35_006134 [Gossypium stocksii]
MEELANLNFIDDEDDAFHEEAAMMDRKYQFNLVGRCLTNSVVYFPSLRNSIADLWHHIGGIYSRGLNGAGSENGPMDLLLDKENNPLLTMEGKKRQRVVGDITLSLGNDIEGGLHDTTSSSTGQSSRMQ